jgi:hypothetical protein
MTSTRTLALFAAMLIAGAGFVANSAYAQSGKKSARAAKPAALGKSSRAPKWGILASMRAGCRLRTARAPGCSCSCAESPLYFRGFPLLWRAGALPMLGRPILAPETEVSR